MAETFPPHLVDLQRRANAARAALAAHRADVDKDREAGRQGTDGPLRPWTQKEDDKHNDLLKEVITAATQLRAAIPAERLKPTFDVLQGLKDAAREPAGTS
ncbi:hypothetical protein ACWERV_32750 [Streptomyces sp. NPDC004031]